MNATKKFTSSLLNNRGNWKGQVKLTSSAMKTPIENPRSRRDQSIDNASKGQIHSLASGYSFIFQLTDARLQLKIKIRTYADVSDILSTIAAGCFWL